MRSVILSLTVVVALSLGPSRAALAEGDSPQGAVAPVPSTALLGLLATQAEQFEEMKKRGSYTASGVLEQVDGKGDVAGRKEVVLKVVATGAAPKTDIVSYKEDGQDKTAEARTKAEARKAEKAAEKKPAKDLFHLPFLSTEQPKYSFALGARDPRDASRVLVQFEPREPTEGAIKGSAWVDEKTGEILTMGFSLSKNPTFIDHVDVTVRFDTKTPLGRAPSRIEFQARGGMLFIHERYRGSISIADARLTP